MRLLNLRGIRYISYFAYMSLKYIRVFFCNLSLTVMNISTIFDLLGLSAIVVALTAGVAETLGSRYLHEARYLVLTAT